MMKIKIVGNVKRYKIGQVVDMENKVAKKLIELKMAEKSGKEDK